MRNAKSSINVTPGSLLLKLVHSGLWTGMRASASSSSSWYRRSSSVGICQRHLRLLLVHLPSVTFKLTRSRTCVATSL